MLQQRLRTPEPCRGNLGLLQPDSGKRHAPTVHHPCRCHRRVVACRWLAAHCEAAQRHAGPDPSGAPRRCPPPERLRLRAVGRLARPPLPWVHRRLRAVHGAAAGGRRRGSRCRLHRHAAFRRRRAGDRRGALLHPRRRRRRGARGHRGGTRGSARVSANSWSTACSKRPAMPGFGGSMARCWPATHG